MLQDALQGDQAQELGAGVLHTSAVGDHEGCGVGRVDSRLFCLCEWAGVASCVLSQTMRLLAAVVAGQHQSDKDQIPVEAPAVPATVLGI